MKLNFTFFIASVVTQFLFASCASPGSEKKIENPPIPSRIKADTTIVTNKEQILGTWDDLGKEPKILEISKQTFLYPEHGESHTYRLTADSIYINYLDLVLVGKPYLIDDTLVIALNEGEDKYIRHKK